MRAVGSASSSWERQRGLGGQKSAVSISGFVWGVAIIGVDWEIITMNAPYIDIAGQRTRPHRQPSAPVWLFALVCLNSTLLLLLVGWRVIDRVEQNRAREQIRESLREWRESMGRNQP